METLESYLIGLEKVDRLEHINNMSAILNGSIVNLYTMLET